ncbi:hepatic leukemia factor-like isoform X2 [Trichoplusia ni]|uniref:Hepatic leukemia factor-like isoform X2 n=1 Tax=Trichoplusia ni TaxID=7111 RepID=A0A7E5WNK6_TRINI|nr:hepatic leukemia factor-like isoform X2 [Trichoplusia ni]
MALWTPYAQEAALDLSRSSVKLERVPSPLPAASAPQSPPLSGFYPSYADTQYYHSYPYQPVTYAVPSAMSPDSNGSWSNMKQNAPSSPESPEFYDSESLSDDVEYQAFERDALRAMAEKNGGTLLGNNPRMRRAVQTSQTADDSYRKQRERNNYAAKQSRDRRKLREVRLAFQVTYLKKKMADLRAKLSAGVCGRCQQTCEC